MSETINEIKVTELNEAQDFDEGDYLYIVHNGESQKISVPQLANLIIESGCGDGTAENPFPFGCFVDYTSFMEVSISASKSIRIPFDCFLRPDTNSLNNPLPFYMSTSLQTLYSDTDSLVTPNGIRGFYIQAGMYIGGHTDYKRKVYIYPLMNGNIDTSFSTHESKKPLSTIIDLISSNSGEWFTDDKAGVYGSDKSVGGKTINQVSDDCTKITLENLSSTFKYWFIYLPLKDNYCVCFQLSKKYPRMTQAKVIFNSASSKKGKLIRFCYTTNDNYKQHASDLVATFLIAKFESS